VHPNLTCQDSVDWTRIHIFPSENNNVQEISNRSYNADDKADVAVNLSIIEVESNLNKISCTKVCSEIFQITNFYVRNRMGYVEQYLLNQHTWWMTEWDSPSLFPEMLATLPWS